LQSIAVYCSLLQCVAVHYSVLQCVAVCCSTLLCIAEYCSMLQYVAVCCKVCCKVFQCLFQCVAKCFSVLQCVHSTYLPTKAFTYTHNPHAPFLLHFFSWYINICPKMHLTFFFHLPEQRRCARRQVEPPPLLLAPAYCLSLSYSRAPLCLCLSLSPLLSFLKSHLATEFIDFI